MSPGPFRRPVVLALVTLSVASFSALVVASIVIPPIDRMAAVGANGKSRSAIGHAAFVELLRQSGYEVLLSRDHSSEKAAGGALLMLAEPELLPGESGERDLADLLAHEGTALLVLPKRTGTPSGIERGHLDSAGFLHLEDVDRVLHAAGVDGRVHRTSDRVQGSAWASEEIPFAPELRKVQLLDAPGLEPILWCEQGALLARSPPVEGSRPELFVLADPDLIATHGLWRGDNASVALAAVERALGGGTVVVLDEALHGAPAQVSLWRALFEFPLALLLAQVLLTSAVLVGAGLVRFGAPLQSRPPLEPGLEYLIQNTAELMRLTGHSGSVLRHYMRLAHRDVAQALWAGGGGEGARDPEVIEHAESLRGVTTGLNEIEERVASAISSTQADKTLAAADLIHRWKKEMLHGTGSRS